MERFRKYAAAFMLVVFITSSVGSWSHQAKAQIPGLSDIIAGAVKGIGEGILGTAVDVGKLALILEEVTGMKKKMEEKTEGLVSFAEDMRNSFYVLNSLRIIDCYTRDVSQFVSNVVTGRFYNFRSAVYAAQSVVREVKYLADCITDLRSLLSKNHGTEGESTSKQTVIMTVHEKLLGSYKEFQDLKAALIQEDANLAQEAFRKAVFYRNVLGHTEALKQWETMNGPKYGF